MQRSKAASVCEFLLLAVTAAMLLEGCALTAGGGWATGTPDAWPRAQKFSLRGPMSRDGSLLLGAELATEHDVDATRVRRGAFLGGLRFRDPELGRDPLGAEIAATIGVGRGDFDPGREDFGFVTGLRLDTPVPVLASPSASGSRARAVFARFELVPYLHGDAIWRSEPGDTVAWSAEAGLGLRLTLGSDMTGMDLFRQVF